MIVSGQIYQALQDELLDSFGNQSVTEGGGSLALFRGEADYTAAEIVYSADTYFARKNHLFSHRHILPTAGMAPANGRLFRHRSYYLLSGLCYRHNYLPGPVSVSGVSPSAD